jgi:hypothetical protein
MRTSFRGPLAIVLLAAATFACGGGDQAQAPPGTAAAAPATTAAAATTGSAGEFGVPECDSYMQKYRACLDKNVPANMRGTYQTALDQTSASWRQAAATPQGKAALADGCRQAEAMAKQSMAAYNCTW